ncbi:MAG: nitroreductase family protein [Thermoplasmata archaeon]|nr:nitroreductase family protein [Thermoplasmata archaeon]
MDTMEMMRQRHSVRRYADRPIEDDKKKELDSLAAEINGRENMHIQIVYDEPECFSSRKASYGKFSGVRNYISVTGPKNGDLEAKAGYWGEELVLKAQELGLNTCWVGMTHGKSAAAIGKSEKEAILIALGYGETQGAARKSKSVADVSNYAEGMPQWFLDGVEAALLAPTAMNQQKFRFTYNDDGTVTAKAGLGFYAGIDLGIARCHFEKVSGVKTK